MDPVTLGMANAATKKRIFANSQISPKLAAFHRVMQLAVRDTNLLVVGDSTGDGTDRWPRRLCNKLAVQYPDWTIVYAPWADASKSYPAGDRVTVQTGTNGRTLIVWNASVSGQVISYALNFLSQILAPITAINSNGPDIVFVNYGHNSPQLADLYRPVAQPTINAYTNNCDKALIVVGTQNPRDPVIWATNGGNAGTSYAEDQGKQQATYEMAAANGHLLVDVNAHYLANPTYSADWLNPDGLHPNSAGSQVWADLMWDAITPGRTVQTSTVPNGDLSRVWIPATHFQAGGDGTPELTALGGVPVWALDDATTESIVAVVDWPSHWRTVNINLVYCTPTSVTGNIRVEGFHKYLGTRNGVSQSAGNLLGSWTSGGARTHDAQGTQGIQSVKAQWDRTGLGSLPVALKFTRLGGDAADTLTGDVLITGIQIDRAW